MLRRFARVSDVFEQFQGNMRRIPNIPAAVLPSREAARAALGIADTVRLVVAWAGPIDERSGVFDVIEAAAICDDRVAVLIPASGPFDQRVADRADAMELLHRVRFVPVAKRHGSATRPNLQTLPVMLAAADALIAVPSLRRATRRLVQADLAMAGAHGIPVILSGKATDHDGIARWTVRPGDPGLLARLLMELVARPGLLNRPQAPSKTADLTATVSAGKANRSTWSASPRGVRAWPLVPGRAQDNP